MKRTAKRLLAGALAVAFIIPSAGAFAAEKKTDQGGIRIEARYFKPDLTLDAKTSHDDLAVDFKNELGMEANNEYEYRIFLGDKFWISYTQFGFDGLRNVNNITYDGKTYRGAVDSKVDLKYAKATWIRPLSRSRNVNFLFDIKAVDLKTRVHGELSGEHNGQATSEYRFRGALPTVGVAVKNKLGKNADIYAEATGLYISKFGHVYDAEAGMKLTVGKGTAIDIGYRIFDINYKRDSGSSEEERAQLRLNGPYFGLVHKF